MLLSVLAAPGVGSRSQDLMRTWSVHREITHSLPASWAVWRTATADSSIRAIEVWNEQNLNYEWGNKPINAAEYVQLLKEASAAIRAACPNYVGGQRRANTGRQHRWAEIGFVSGRLTISNT